MCSGLTAGAAIGCTALPLPGVGAAFDGIFFAAGEPAASPPDGAMPTVLLMLARAPAVLQGPGARGQGLAVRYR